MVSFLFPEPEAGAVRKGPKVAKFLVALTRSLRKKRIRNKKRKRDAAATRKQQKRTGNFGWMLMFP